MKAPRYLGLMYLNGEGVAQNVQTAFAYFTQAAEAGDITGQYWLGYCYENGVGTEKDMTQACAGIRNPPHAATMFPSPPLTR